jgi:hypothetical protein
MSWFNRFFNKGEGFDIEIIQNDVPTSTLVRWYLHDLVVESPNEIAAKFGLTPISDEGIQKEEQDSQYRIQKLAPLIPYLNLIADINARVIAYTQLRASMSEGLEDEIEELMEFYAAVGMSALISAFASGIEIGIIQPTSLNTTIDIQEQDYE